jgi:putative addiction module component (TIGR02574 family)
LQPAQLSETIKSQSHLVVESNLGATKMTPTAESLKSSLARLSHEDRAELAYFLIQSLGEGEDADAEAAWDAELARRLAEIKSGKEQGEPAAKVFAELREKYS